MRYQCIFPGILRYIRLLIHLPFQLGKLLRKFNQLIFIGIHFWNWYLYLFHAIRDFGEHAQRIGNGNQKHAHKRDRDNMCLHPLKDQIPRIPHDLTVEKCTDDIPYRKDTDAQKHMKKISSSPLAQQFCFVHPLLLQFISNAPDGLDKLRFSAVFMHFLPNLPTQRKAVHIRQHHIQDSRSMCSLSTQSKASCPQ